MRRVNTIASGPTIRAAATGPRFRFIEGDAAEVDYIDYH